MSNEDFHSKVQNIGQRRTGLTSGLCFHSCMSKFGTFIGRFPSEKKKKKDGRTVCMSPDNFVATEY